MSTYPSRQFWLTKFIYAWLILCLGGIGPFIYISTASPHHGLPGHHISIFGETIRPLPAELVSKLSGRSLAQQIHSGLAYQRLLPGNVCLFQIDLNQVDLLTGMPRHPNQSPALIGQVTGFALSNQSISVLPLDKPPQIDQDLRKFL